MLRWRLQTLLIAVAAVAVYLATLIPTIRDLGIYHATAWVKAGDAPRTARLLNSRGTCALVATDPAVAALPEIRGASDPAAAVGRLVRAEVIPNTYLVEVGARSTSITTATTLADALTARAALDPANTVVTTARGATRDRSLGSLFRRAGAELLGVAVLGLVGWGLARLIRPRPPRAAVPDRAAFLAAAAVANPWPRA